MSSASLPASPPNTPGFPQNPFPITFKGFETLNTKPRRPGIKDQEMYWCDGFMPLGESNARTLPGIGSALYTSPTAATGTGQIVYFGFACVPQSDGIAGEDLQPICLAGRYDGSLVAINMGHSYGSATTILGAGSLGVPNLGAINMAVGQWSNQYAIITCCAYYEAGVLTGNNSYWLYDGTNVFGQGTLSPQVTIADGGSGYGSAPTITARGGSGTGATFSATVSNGSITSVKVTNPGSGYLVGETPILTVSGGGASQDQAYGTVTIATTNGIASVYVNAGGTGYSSSAQVLATGGGGSGATFQLVGSNGTITGVTVVNPGSGYTSAPTLTVTDTSGTGASITAVLAQGQIGSASITNGGSGYNTAPTVNVIGDGTGAIIQAIIDTTTYHNVTSLQVVNPGVGYTYAAIEIVGGNNSAQVTTTLMPFGIGGNTVESYQGRVWLGNIHNGYVSSPGSPSDFDPANGAVFFQATDPFLQYAYVAFKQTNGFLYLLGDSSISAISGVATSGNPPITTFNNQNVDPQLGITSFSGTWQSSGVPGLGGTAACAQVFSRNIIFLNRNGVYVSYGGSVTKVSEQLDGIQLYSDVGGQNEVPYNSTAIANIFGVEVFMFLASVVDPYTNTNKNKFFLWDGKKWFSTDQNLPNGTQSAYFIASDSSFNAYVTDLLSIYPMFTSPTTGFNKVIQSKFWDAPAIYFKKMVTQVFATVYVNASDSSTNYLYVDSNPDSPTESAACTSTNATTGLQIYTNPINFYGQYLGLTFKTSAQDITLIELLMMGNIQQSMVR